MDTSLDRSARSSSAGDTSSEMEVSLDASSKSIDCNTPTPAKRVKLSETDKKLLATAREKNRQEMQQLKLEREMSKIERERERIEKAKQKQKAKEEREQKLKEAQDLKKQQEEEKNKLKEEEKNRREAERVEKENERIRLKEEKERKLLEKEQERIKKEQEKKDKEVEKLRQKEQKELEKQKKLDEKQAIEDARKKAEEEEKQKLEKSKNLMFNFLKKATKAEGALDTSIKSKDESEYEGITPRELLDKFDPEQFRESIDCGLPKENLYLDQLRRGEFKPFHKSVKTQPKEDDSIEYLDDLPDGVKREPYIFLQFYENIRPAYFGPMPRKPEAVKPTKPLAKEEFLDYEYDSDLEWDEGGPGESLSASESEEEDDYEIDDFFVPHGYLSDDEAENQVDLDDPDRDEGLGGNTEVDETKKSKLKEGLLQKDKARLAELNSKYAKPMHPQFISCIWESTPECEKEKEKFEFLKMFSITRMVYPTPGASSTNQVPIST